MVSTPRRRRLDFAGPANVVGLAVHAADAGIGGVADDAEFRGEHDLVTLAFDGAAYEFFIFVRAVDIGGVEEVDAEFERAVNRGEGFLLVESGVELGHAHASQALGGDFEVAAA